jgi:hypothetical protein
MKLFGREPALVLGLITSAILLIGTFGLSAFSGDQAGLAVALVSALGTAAIGIFTRPLSPSLFTAVVAAAVPLLASYGLNIPIETVAALNSVVIAFLVFLTRGDVSPVETTLTKA